ncbi:lysine-rich nucleolar protein 1-like [Lineus longissimus]|uniref:lysine-rich nucleolar protein 1-like n=1 Tax=Lineus longissimus TaxID=88925 RepID=UPI00315D5F53
MKEKSKNKKRKHLEDGGKDSQVPKKQIKDALGEAVGLTLSKTKKRKMGKDDNGDTQCENDVIKEGKKKRKKKKEDRKLDLDDIGQVGDPDAVHVTKKKKKKSKRKDLLESENVVVGKTKKKACDTSGTENDGMGNSGAVEKKEKKKKKKQNKIKQSDISVPSENVASVSKKHTKKDKGVSGVGHSDAELDPKKKKKSERKEKDIGDTDKCDDVGKKKMKDKQSVLNEIISSEGVKKNEKKKRKDTDDVVGVDNDSDEVVSTDKVKKGKKRKQKDVDDIVGDDNDVPVSKKKKKGKKDRSPDTDIINSVSGAKRKKKDKKRGLKEGEDDKNGDDSCGSPVSNKKPIEKVVASENLAVENENGGQLNGGSCKSRPSINLGQWGTATFDDKERQDKFYRLLGGFKKKTDTPVQNTAVTNSVKKLNPFVNPNSPFLRKNLALSSSDAKNLDDNLEKDFNRAMEWKLTMPRGTGIGYTPPPDANKVFYIDKTKSSSIKFD